MMKKQSAQHTKLERSLCFLDAVVVRHQGNHLKFIGITHLCWFGVAQVKVSRIHHGERKSLSISALDKLHRLSDVTPDK